MLMLLKGVLKRFKRINYLFDMFVLITCLKVLELIQSGNWSILVEWFNTVLLVILFDVVLCWVIELIVYNKIIKKMKLSLSFVCNICLRSNKAF